MSDLTIGTSTLGRVRACLRAAGDRVAGDRAEGDRVEGDRVEGDRRTSDEVWELVGLELREAQEYLERFDPGARDVDSAPPSGETLELVRSALALLDDADPYEQGVEILALRVRVRWIEHLLAPESADL